jgi:hypothetical protein
MDILRDELTTSQREELNAVDACLVKHGLRPFKTFFPQQTGWKIVSEFKLPDGSFGEIVIERSADRDAEAIWARVETALAAARLG